MENLNQAKSSTCNIHQATNHWMQGHKYLNYAKHSIDWSNLAEDGIRSSCGSLLIVSDLKDVMLIKQSFIGKMDQI